MKKSAPKNSQAETASSKDNQIAHDQEVNQLAYELWEAAGGHHGDDMRHWLEAERKIKARRQNEKPM